MALGITCGTGLPDSMAETKAKLTRYDFALKYLAMKWPHAAPNTRDGINESLHRTRPSVGKKWTDLGESHDDRGLKNRPAEDVRRVPIPPQLVAILSEHLDAFGSAVDARQYYSEGGGVVASST